jgi:HAMP domain-containing protein
VTWVVVAILAVVVAVVVAVLAVRRSRDVDGVEQFKRQIDALSPEARRPVVDKVAQLDDETASTVDAAASEPAAPEAPPEAPDEATPGDTDAPPEDPPRGT